MCMDSGPAAARRPGMTAVSRAAAAAATSGMMRRQDAQTFVPQRLRQLQSLTRRRSPPLLRARSSVLSRNGSVQAMAADIFAKIGDIKGESADDKHKGEIEVLSFSWGVNNAQSITGAG